MAQRYAAPRAQERMAQGACPECGQAAEAHIGWWGAGCSLRDDGVADRIAQYRADLDGGVTTP